MMLSDHRNVVAVLRQFCATKFNRMGDLTKQSEVIRNEKTPELNKSDNEYVCNTLINRAKE